MSDFRVRADELERWTVRVLAEAGLRRNVAELVADTLVQANLRGVDSHGVIRVPVYLRRLREGLLNRDPEPRVERSDGGVALIDGDHGPGQWAAVRATDLAVELASAHGIGAVGVRRSSHYGAAAFYVMRMAERGMIGFTTANVEPDVVPFGGAEAALGTNPLAFAAAGSRGTFVLDMATSQVAMGRILLARERGEELGEGWAVDAEGRPTRDANEAVSAVPLGGPKGYGLALMVEVLGGVLPGANIASEVGRMYDDWDRPQDVGHFFLALDPERMIGREAFRDRMDRLWDMLKAVPAAPGFEGVLVPGESEARTHAARSAGGIPIPEKIWRALEEEARVSSVALPEPEA